LPRLASIALPLLCVALTAATPWSVEGRAEADVGYDSNVYRNFDGVSDPTLPGNGAVVGDGFLQLDGDLDVSGRPWAHQHTDLALDIGGRLFASQWEEDTLVGAATLVHDIGLSRKLSLRFDASGKDKWVENDDRAFADYGAGVALSLGPWAKTRFDVRAGYQAFVYFPDTDFSELGPSFSISLSSTPWTRQTLAVGYRLMPQFYQGPQVFPSGAEAGQRFDWYHLATASYTLQAPIVLSVIYSFIDDDSDSYGESYLRNRVQLVVGAALPWELFLVGMAAVQLTSYPDGLYLSPELLLLEDDDDLDEVGVKISKDVGKGFSIEARYGFYYNGLQQNGLTYERHVAYLGVAWRH
jgi:hypothetical protein